MRGDLVDRYAVFDIRPVGLLWMRTGKKRRTATSMIPRAVAMVSGPIERQSRKDVQRLAMLSQNLEGCRQFEVRPLGARCPIRHVDPIGNHHKKHPGWLFFKRRRSPRNGRHRFKPWQGNCGANPTQYGSPIELFHGRSSSLVPFR